MSFEEEFKKVDKQSKEVSKTAENILRLLDKNGYDDAIIILRKGQEVSIAVSDANSQFAPYMLDGLYNELNERNKIVFAMNLLNIDIDELIKTILEEEQENED